MRHALFLLWLVVPTLVFAAAAPPRTLIKNAALVVTMDPARGQGPLGLLENADVLLADGRIEAVGHGLSDDQAMVVEAAGKIALPGFIDVHDHLWQSLIRGCGVDKELYGWLEECVMTRAGDVMSADDVFAGVRLSLVDLIDTGVTTVVDDSHSFTPAFVNGNLKALDESGIRFVYAYCGGVGSERTVLDIRRVKQEKIDPNPLATLQVCAHPAQNLRPALETLGALARELKVDFNVHLLESPSQRKDTPVALLRETKLLNSSLLANHVVHPNDAEIEEIGKAGVKAAHNPLSNMRLGSGIAPVGKLHEAGVRVGLGLDGGTNDTSDFFANMKAAVGLQRARHEKASVYPTPADALRMATMGGAEALGREKDLGSLTPGKRADVILIDPNAPNFAPRIAWIEQLVLNGRPSNVEWVWVEGRALKAKGEVTAFPRVESVAAAEAAAARIKTKLAAGKTK